MMNRTLTVRIRATRMVLIACVAAFAVMVNAEEPSQEAAPTIKIECKRSIGDQERYQALAEVDGEMKVPGAAQPTPVQLNIETIVKYAVVKPSVPETTEVIISSESANILLGETKLPAPASPQTIVRIDSSGKIASITGGDRFMGITGANLGSLMTLMLPGFPKDAMQIGYQWSTESPISSVKRKLVVKYTLLGVETIDEQQVAKIKQEFRLSPTNSEELPRTGELAVSGEAISHFSVSDGRFMKSQADINVKTDSGATNNSPEINAKVKLNVTLLPK